MKLRYTFSLFFFFLLPGFRSTQAAPVFHLPLPPGMVLTATDPLSHAGNHDDLQFSEANFYYTDDNEDEEEGMCRKKGISGEDNASRIPSQTLFHDLTTSQLLLKQPAGFHPHAAGLFVFIRSLRI